MAQLELQLELNRLDQAPKVVVVVEVVLLEQVLAEEYVNY
jgi:hypothetical protein